MAGVTLSLDEAEGVVLEIAVSGAPMMALWMWKEAVLSLWKRGFLRKADDVNYLITDAGRAALAALQEEETARLKAAIERDNPREAAG